MFDRTEKLSLCWKVMKLICILYLDGLPKFSQTVFAINCHQLQPLLETFLNAPDMLSAQVTSHMQVVVVSGVAQ